MKTPSRPQLQALINKWLASQHEYQLSSIRDRQDDPQTAARYEGEAIAFRWCAEDLEALLLDK